MILLILGLALFLGTHSLAMALPAWREARRARLGATVWQGVLSPIALLGLVLIVIGYGAARDAPVLLYQPPLWLRHVALLLMVPVFPLLFAAYLPGRLRAALGHPMLAAVKLWAIAHLLANGTLADVLLFGSFLLWAVADRLSFKWRAATPVAGAPLGPWNDFIAVGAGLALYGAFLLVLHRWWIGIAPLG